MLTVAIAAFVYFSLAAVLSEDASPASFRPG